MLQSIIIPLVIQFLSGSAGGGIVGNLMKNVDMGMLAKVLLGGVGGLVGGGAVSGAGPLGSLGGLLGMGASMMGGGDAAGGLDIGSIIGQVAGGAVGGGALTGIGGLLASMMKKSGAFLSLNALRAVRRAARLVLRLRLFASLQAAIAVCIYSESKFAASRCVQNRISMLLGIRQEAIGFREFPGTTGIPYKQAHSGRKSWES